MDDTKKNAKDSGKLWSDPTEDKRNERTIAEDNQHREVQNIKVEGNGLDECSTPDQDDEHESIQTYEGASNTDCLVGATNDRANEEMPNLQQIESKATSQLGLTKEALVDNEVQAEISGVEHVSTEPHDQSKDSIPNDQSEATIEERARNQEKVQDNNEKVEIPMAEREPLIASGRFSGRSSAYRDIKDVDSDVNVVCSRPGSAVDANINVSYQDNSSDYHDYSTRIGGARTDNSSDTSIILYKRRWYILLVFSLCVALQNAVWGTWGPIAESAKFVYGWDTKMVFIIINCGNIGVLLPALFTGHLISSKGIRISMVTCSFLLALGAGLRTISKHKLAGTILIGAGQFCNGLAGSITQVIPAALSETWFPVHERATATAIGVISNSLGCIVSFMLGPNLVDEPDGESSTDSNRSLLYSEMSEISGENNTLSQETETISRQIWILTMIEFGVGAVLFIVTIVYFPAKPPYPPSRSAREQRINFTQGLCSVVRQPLILLAALSCAVPWAVYGNWMGLLSVNLHEIGISQNQSGLFGFYASIAGIVGGIAIGRIADRFQRRLKVFVMLVFFLALMIIIWITFMRLNYLPRSIALFGVSISALAVMMNAALPLCYEMACECGYPIHEGIIGTFISLEINAAAVIFLLIKLIPNIGVIWMNWTFVGVLGTSILCLAFLREKYLRADIDIVKTIEPPDNNS